MKKRVFSFCLLCFVAWVLTGCVAVTYPLADPADWSKDVYWYQDEQPLDENKVDVFYVTSTDVLSSKDSCGHSSPLALLTEEECEVLRSEMDWFRKRIYTSEFNYFAPMYHQVTFESLGNPHGGKDPLWEKAAQEVCEAFDFYMAHDNHGRRFILAGFSQGASILRAILKHMTDEQYSRCVAAYAIGFQVTAEDLECPRIRPAQGADDQGVIISFNSVRNLEGEWELVSGDAVCGINPVNWRTDATPAQFEFKGQQLTATLDPERYLMVVKDFVPYKTPYSHLFPEGNLHTFDRVLYAKFLKENALLRAYGNPGAVSPRE